MSKFSCLLLVLCFLAAAAAVSASETKTWQTLNGDAPLVIARGGFSGVFPDSSELAYRLASRFSLPNMVSWCNVQLTLDGYGICIPHFNLQNTTNIPTVFPNNQSTYPVNGIPTTGWFSSNFLLKDLSKVNLTQGIYSRSSDFNSEFPILTVQDVAKLPISPDSTEPRALWLNFQNNAFYKQQGLSMEGFATYISKLVDVKYVSSPELSFLMSYNVKFNPKPKLILQFGEKSEIDPSTKIRYGDYLDRGRLALLKDSFIDGILVPKSYIWPVDSESSLLTHTTLVSDAHDLGLTVFVSGISNDAPFANDFNYDPVAQILAFIDNKNFSVDGVLSDFPVTPSAAIDCFSHMGDNDPPQRKVLVISHEGASGVYPGCTDLAYKTAFDDGVDIIDCPVQMTKDGLALCLGSINLMERTNVAESPFANLTREVPELGDTGVFTFDLTWDDFQILKPEMYDPVPEDDLHPNPKSRNAGKFMPLWVLLQNIISHRQSTTKSVSGILISIENAAYLSEKHGLNVTKAILDALQASHFDRMATGVKVMIHSSDRAVLIKFKGERKEYECVYESEEDLQDVNSSKISEVKQFADSVIVSKEMEYPYNVQYLTGETKIIQQLKGIGFSVYVKLFRNEFVYENWDFLSDPYVELDTFVERAGADGVITDFPRTANNYKRNRCLGMSKKPSYMMPIKPAEFLKYIGNLPPGVPSSSLRTGNRRLGMHNIHV